MKFTLNITHRCNLNCRYCYSGRKFQTDMPFEVAEKSVDFALATAPEDTPVEFSFFGGEPLLCFDLIQELTEAIHQKAVDSKQKVRLTLTTNGTLLSESVLEWIKENHVDLCISMDGPETIHNANRRFRNGQGSFPRVLGNLRRAMDVVPQLQVNAVYGPETMEAMAETLAFFIDHQVPVVHFNPDICTVWRPSAFPALEKAYHRMAETYLAAFRNEREVAVNLIDSKMILFLKGGYTPDDVCGMGQTEMAVSAAGYLYPCERFVGEDDDPSFRIGHVSAGFDAKRRCAVLKGRGNHTAVCRQCTLQNYCMNWCGCTNYHMTGKTDQAGAMLCASEQAAIREARYVFTTLADEQNELFIDHLMHYANKGCGSV